MANVAPYSGVINLSFMQPDNSYKKGSGNTAGTGLQFPYDGPTLKAAIKALRARLPATRIMVAVGGATYTNWANLNVAGLADFVTDFGLDGVDLDYEPLGPICTPKQASVSCGTDTEFGNVISAVTKALPLPHFTSAALFSTGAYAQGAWANSPPASAYAGVSVNPLRTSGAALRWINVMSYDASNAYDPATALAAYRSLYKGPIHMGVEIPPEAWGGHIYTLAEVDVLTTNVLKDGNGGVMIWSLQKQPAAMAAANNPSPTLMLQQVCNRFQLGSCNSPVY